MIPPDPHVSDLVQDSKIETRLVGDHFVHVFYDSGTSAQDRFLRREEEWVRQRVLGHGTFGTIYLEKCVSGRRKSDLRAVKEIKKIVLENEQLDCARELEAVAKFSHPKVRHCLARLSNQCGIVLKPLHNSTPTVLYDRTAGLSSVNQYQSPWSTTSSATCKSTC